MALMPGARHRLIAKHNVRRMAVYNRVNLHVAVSEAASLHGFFSGAGVCSHFYVAKDGTIEQYIDTAFRSAADLQGNDATISIETQGGVHDANGEPWTDAQLEALARIFAWACATHPSIPLHMATDSRLGASSKGLSWHRLGVDPWRVSGGMRYSNARGKVCPGDAKIAQIPQVLALAVGARVPVSVPAAPAPVAPAPAPAPAPTYAVLRRGATGLRVQQIQQTLKSNYPAYAKHLAVDGIFGPATEKAVKEFQRRSGLVVDGIVGPRTLAALGY